MESYQKWKPIVVRLVICFVMPVLNILFKKILDEGTNQLVIITYRMSTAAIFLAPIAYFFERQLLDDIAWIDLLGWKEIVEGLKEIVEGK